MIIRQTRRDDIIFQAQQSAFIFSVAREEYGAQLAKL